MIVKLISRIPFRLLYILSDILYFPVYYIVRYRRKIVRSNLVESFPEISHKEIVSIEKKFYHFLIDMIFETCKLSSISHDEIMRRMKFINADKVNGMLVQGKSISVFMGHCGNWEWVSSFGLWLDNSAIIVSVYHRLRNSFVNKAIKSIRERFGNISVDMRKTAKSIARISNAPIPHIFGFIADQSPRRCQSNHYTDFLNHNIPVLTGTEKLTKRYGYEALFLSVRRIQRGYYECEFIPLHDAPATLPDFELTRLYFQQLEKEITAQPECYLWSHNRFKYSRNKYTH
ncbi:MAG: lysophospholipid acyltransferase family protein [Muribaculaceae bacterium]|nr:lysophospholipid acyltransferase family protein [Muribaculaceae bacterium]